jgi:hypothetical protein
MDKEKEALSLLFPADAFIWFDIRNVKTDADNVYVVFEEKDIPPLTEENKNKKILKRKFRNITITDFPIRGKRTILTFRRRYWKLEGEKEYLKRDIPLAFPGTKLEKEFADFLKEDGGRGTLLAGFYRKVSKDPSERI